MPPNEFENTFVDSNYTLQRIVAHHSKFLSFLASRVEDNAVAEDILQSAYIKAIEHGSAIRKDESMVA